MAFLLDLLFSSLMLFFIPLSDALKFIPPPKALVLPVLKDPSTLQYVTHINQGTPLVPTKLVVDLGGRFLWVDCQTGYKSSSYKPGHCGSTQCAISKSNSCGQCLSSPRPGCNNNTCGLTPENTATKIVHLEELAVDVISLQSTDGSKSGPTTTVPNFIFSCAQTSLLQGLATGTKGMAGLGRTQIALPTQLTSAFARTILRKFALCLSSSTKSNGVIFFGDAPYIFYPDYNTSKSIDISKRFEYIPLIVNPVSTAGAFVKGEPSVEYFIDVKSIMIEKTVLPLNTSLLSINKNGVGGTKISTVNPYTVMETTIYKALTKAYIKELAGMKIDRVASVKPFEVCVSSKNVALTGLGPSVPEIHLVFASMKWSIYGVNSMVEVSKDVLCLGFVDGGYNPRTSIVIGGYQLEDNLLQFDLAASRLGFSSSLLWEAAACANFNFKSNHA